MSASGVVSDELAIVPHQSKVPHYVFPDEGDSGSFALDSDGYMSGMMYGGHVNRFITHVTPIKYILEDIRQVCAKDVRLVVQND
jgi:hypothetical protein